MQPTLDFDRHLAEDSARFLDALGRSTPEMPVPSCPDWTADDLLWHLAEVQGFWAAIVADRLADPAEAEASKPARPADREGLLGYAADCGQRLRAALADAADAMPVWTWSDDKTVAFVRRRQAHEALVHRVDAELTIGQRSPMDPELCADGVDEVLRVMYGGAPSWGTFTPYDDRAARMTATDTGASWLVLPGRFTGTDPDSGPVDEDDLRVADEGTAAEAAHIRATAADLDCWLWHRDPAGPVERGGDAEVLGRLDRILSQAIN